MYTDEQMAYMKRVCRDFNYFFGYASHPDEAQQDPSTVFFQYEEGEHNVGRRDELYRDYLRLNKNTLARATQPSLESFDFNHSFPVDPNMKMLGAPRAQLQIKE